MADILLYFAPGTCARVPLIALFEAGANFETALIRFMKGQHKSPAFKSVNPKGKVPTLVVGGEALTENVAILSHLNLLFPAAGLLPRAPSQIDAARQIADLCFCSASLHPLVTRIRMPGRFASADAARSVRDKACEAMHEHFGLIETRLGNGPWWFGDTWSVMDAYLNWVFWRVEGAEFPVANYPRFIDHAQRMKLRPSYRQAMEVEAAANAQLEAEGAVFKPSA
jgi:glutathione S-transferase